LSLSFSLNLRGYSILKSPLPNGMKKYEEMLNRSGKVQKDLFFKMSIFTSFYQRVFDSPLLHAIGRSSSDYL
jgi:hypothetical protein